MAAGGGGLEVARAPRRLRSFEPRPEAVRRHADHHPRWQRLHAHARDFA
jgi:hypothetical protein